MGAIKKSANISNDIAQMVDNFIKVNPGVSFTLIVNQALKEWLKNPSVELNRTPATNEDVDQFLRDNSELMDDLAK
ncbi:MAG: hypothetical protein KDD50_08440 [Bdellovibrionales bacterium]|nr:hypothetical protein [Bdellovibrionales bacterium]